MFFPNPLPETIFGGSKCQPMLESTILEPFWIQGGPTNGPFGLHFRPKRRQKPSPPNYFWRPGADLGAKWRRKRPKTTQGSNLIDLLMNFGLIWDPPHPFGCRACQIRRHQAGMVSFSPPYPPGRPKNPLRAVGNRACWRSFGAPFPYFCRAPQQECTLIVVFLLFCCFSACSLLRREPSCGRPGGSGGMPFGLHFRISFFTSFFL